MVVESVPQWPSIVLAVVLFGDAVMSVKPPRFIQRCLDGVNFPRDWWWALIYIKLIAAAGSSVSSSPVSGIAANAGVIAYFVAAAYAHQGEIPQKRILDQLSWHAGLVHCDTVGDRSRVTVPSAHGDAVNRQVSPDRPRPAVRRAAAAHLVWTATPRPSVGAEVRSRRMATTRRHNLTPTGRSECLA